MPKKPVDPGNDGTSSRHDDQILDGRGPSYRLSGGRGNDTYYVDDLGDQVIEKNNAGDDTVYADIDWALSDNLEDLVLGTGDLSGTGNDLDNEITGGLGDNWLDGGGGSDTFDGGEGHDTVVFAGNVGDYAIQESEDIVYVTNPSTGDVNVLRNIETLTFADATLELVSDEPVASDDTVSTYEDEAVIIDLLANDSGENLVIVSVSDPSLGSVTINDDGTVTYTPDKDSFGADSFGYVVRDAEGTESGAVAQVEIVPVNDAPVASDDEYSINIDEVLSGNYVVLNNDTDVDGDSLAVVGIGSSAETTDNVPGEDGIFRVVTSNGGQVSLEGNGSFDYVAADGFEGSDTFSYVVSDGEGGTSTATVELFVSAGVVEKPPTEGTTYYVEDLIFGDPYRLNSSDDMGTGIQVTYSFLSSIPDYYDDNSAQAQTFSAFDEAQQETTRAALAEISSFANIEFVEVIDGPATITFGLADLGGANGLAFKPFGTDTDTYYSDIWLDTAHAASGLEQGDYAYWTLIHEIGHATGLDHSELPDDENNLQYSVMSGSGHPDFGLPDSYQLYDVEALQHLYGANDEYAAGDDVYTYEDLVDQTTVIWDAGGHDTIDLSNANESVSIDLNNGAFSTVATSGANNLAIAFESNIEDAIGGAGDDSIIGNELDNFIAGGAGDDTFTGGSGSDVFRSDLSGGNDVVTDFTVGEDKIDFSGNDWSIEDLMIETIEGGVRVEFDGGSITLEDLDEIDDSFAIF